MTDLLALIAPICGLHQGALRGGLLLGLAAAGAAGSVVHCLPMCGPFVLGQVSDRMARVPAARLHESCRFRQGLLVPYHLGRLATYTALGAVAAGLGGALGGLPWFGGLRLVLLLLAAGLFLAHAAGVLVPSSPGAAPLGRMLRRATSRIERNSAAGTFLLGLALGFLPCGFLYAALLATAAAPSAWQGALGMLAFGIGTVPVLAALGVAGRAAGQTGSRALSRAAPVLMVGNACIILLLAAGSLRL